MTESAAAPAVHISIKAEEIFRLGSFPVTNSLLLSCIVLLFLGGLALIGRKRLRLIPNYFQSVAELFLEGTLGLMDSILGERRKSERYLPLVATIFLFVLFSNWFGLLPGVGSFVVHNAGLTVPLLRSPSADLNFTLALAVVTVFAINILGVIAIGFMSHTSKYFNFKSPIAFFIGLIELVSEIAKLISFSFRLFGNVFAGEVLLTVIAFLAPYFLPLPFMFMEVFVGFIQAFIFSMLALVFVAIATVPHGEGHEAVRAH